MGAAACTPLADEGAYSLEAPLSTASNAKRSQVTKQAPSPRVLIIQNDVLCPPASAISSLVHHEITYQVIYAFHEKAILHLEPLMYEAIIVLGGRCSVNDAPKLPWLANEIKFVKQALKDKVPILGICLGAQILAECVGGSVIAGNNGIEIGFEDWLFDDDDHDDPFFRALKHKDLDKYVILFHGDTFNLPDKCVESGQKVQLLAHTQTLNYKTLFKVGECSYGFQGHPELNYDLIQIWCKSWGDDWLNQSKVNIDKDVLEYARKNSRLLELNSKILFDIWIDVALIHCVPKLSRQETAAFDQYVKEHWNDAAADDAQDEDVDEDTSNDSIKHKKTSSNRASIFSGQLHSAIN